VNVKEKEVWVDFVNHGDGGYASWWAANADVGDILAVATKKRETDFKTDRENFILVADHTGLPVVACLLEKMRGEAKGEVLIEVLTEEDILDLWKPDGINIQWLINPHPGVKSRLEEQTR